MIYEYTLITSPQTRAVYQRDESDQAVVPLEVIYTLPVERIRMQAISDSFTSEWTELSPHSGRASGTLSLPAGPWYTITMEAFDKKNQLIEQNSVTHVGVGERFITCGQSNALNFGSVCLRSESDYVSAYNPITRSWEICTDPQPSEPGAPFDMGDGGSIWCVLGDLLAKKLAMPVGFYATGWGGASVTQFDSGTIRRERLLHALDTFSDTGFRSVLWHQGETDAVYELSAVDYCKYLTILIQDSRTYYGKGFPWMVAKAAYHPKATHEAEQQIHLGQQMVCNEAPALPGPATDILQEGFRIPQSAHFLEKGLRAHAALWYDCLLNTFFSEKLIFSCNSAPPPLHGYKS